MGTQRVLLLVCFAGIQLVTSYPYFRDRIPNGYDVRHPCDNSKTWDGVGHENSAGGGVRNPFGADFDQHDKTWTWELCMADSDGDGMTNGVELGDPDCMWSIGQVPSGPLMGHPGVCEPWDSANCMVKNDFLACDKPVGFNCPATEQPGVLKHRVGFASGTPVPAKETTYMCQGFALPTDNDYHLIATEPDIDNINVAHHILVYGCSEDAELNANHTSKPFECFMGDTEGCSEIIGLWSFGVDGHCYPDEIGFAVGMSGYKHVIYEIHWNNPEYIGDYTDGSGMFLYLTTNKRPNEAGVFMIGQQQLVIPPWEESVTISGGCSGDCTPYLMDGPITVIGTLNHMHGLGVSGLSQVIRPSWEKHDLARDHYYDYNSPVFHMFDEPIIVNPGDALNMTCEFNSMTRDTTTWQGIGTNDEMCYAFLMYYPKENMKTRECVSVGRYDTCDWDATNGDIAGCNPAYRRPGSPEILELSGRLWSHCKVGMCLKECIPVAREFHSNPCFSMEHRFQTLQYLGYLSGTDKLDLMDFYYRADSCMVEIAMEDWDCEMDDGHHGGHVSKATSGFFASLWALFVCLGSIWLLK